jgi:hypothetical protein
MKKISLAVFAFSLFIALISSCKKETTPSVDFSTYVATNEECIVTGTPDSTQWTNSVLTRQTDTALLTFIDNIVITDSLTGPITINPPCPNPSNGFFIWNINPTQQCKLRLVCVNTAYDVVYYNAYGLSGGPITLGFDFRSISTFHTDSSYRIYYGFYNANDSLYISGHGDIKIQQ